MKDHSVFTTELIEIAVKTGRGLGVVSVEDIIRLSAMGVHPELRGYRADYAILDEINYPGEPLDPYEHDSGFVFGNESKAALKGVHPSLAAVATLALKLSTQDFRVYEGLRTLERQKKLVATGASRTLNSMHIKQTDGFGHAVDLVPVIGGILKWDWEGCYKIAFAMDLAATQLGFAASITWGGSWDRTLADYGGDLSEYRKEVERYKTRHAGPDFIDGPHFQIR